MMEELFEEIESYLEDMSNGPESLPSIACGEIRERLDKIKKYCPLPAPQCQDSLSYQLEKLHPVANRMGLYDAADYIKSRDEYLLKMEKKLKELKTLIRSAAESDNCYDILFEYLEKH